MVYLKKNLDAEYNAFGPWILEVTEEYPVPPLFLPYYKENKSCLMLIKIPRNIDRRDAKPGMDLYDYVICMYETYGYILKRQGKEVEEIKFDYDQVESLENFKDLLLGILTIHLNNSRIIIPYNVVSQEIIDQLIKIIRDRYTNKKYEKIESINRIEYSEVTETLYENIINKMNLQGDILYIMAFQPSVKITKNTRQLYQKLLEFIRSNLLLSTLHLSDDRELLVISRGKPIRHLREAVYSYCITYIPIERINNVKFDKYEKYNNLLIVYISIHEHTFKFYFDERNGNLKDFYKKFSNII
jgi:hypothetical protein